MGLLTTRHGSELISDMSDLRPLDQVIGPAEKIGIGAAVNMQCRRQALVQKLLMDEPDAFYGMEVVPSRAVQDEAVVRRSGEGNARGDQGTNNASPARFSEAPPSFERRVPRVPVSRIVVSGAIRNSVRIADPDEKRGSPVRRLNVAYSGNATTSVAMGMHRRFP